jgi:NAD(P)-dependent dehydrogenase (short-subunit alcohol dehydrogenase family)
MISFFSQNILVTGASSGLGASSARLLNSLGACVIAVGRNAERLRDTRESCPYPESFHEEVRDLAENVAELGSWLKGVRERRGLLHGLLHCAGVHDRIAPIRSQGDPELKRLFEINFFAAYHLARAFLDRRNNSGKGSSLVFVASTSALRQSAGISGYASSKGAIISLAKSLAGEFASRGIRVNAVSPGFIETPMTRALHDDTSALAAECPLGPGDPDDAARSAAFLLSPAARWITGQNLIVDGGRGLL